MSVDLLSYVSPFKLQWEFQIYRDLEGNWNGYASAMDGNIQHATPRMVFPNQADVLENVLRDIHVVESQRSR